MDPRSPTTRLLAGYLRQLNHLAGELSGERRHDAAHTAVELLTMALRDMPLAVPRSDNAADVLLRMMMTHVRDHLADPGLTVEELARRHHVSVRHAYAVFARADATPGAYIREQRLLAARAMLADPKLSPRPVAGIGIAVGWPEQRTFERAFRRRYGMSPAGWRRERRVAGPGQR